MARTWFITGASKGFGREWTEAALERGDKVAATARDLSTLEPLVDAYGNAVLPIQLDVVVNNAGYGHFGAIEELSEDDVRAQLETNFFGALWVTQAALPILREQRSGHIIQVSSIGGISAFPTVGAYHASKWALEGFSQSLSQEVAGFGIKVTLIEPTGYSTDWSGSSARHATPLPVYDPIRDAAAKSRAQRFTAPGNPEATRDAILTLADSDNPPLRLFLGESPLRIAVEDYGSRLATWAQWQQIAAAAQGAQ